jgi:hypothetical protein
VNRISKSQNVLMGLITGALLAAGHHATAGEMGTTFTYQGQLRLSGTPLNDSADFEFTLWDAATAGNVVGATVAVDDVAVVDGLFTVELDFGVDVFDGTALWLGIEVRTPHDPTGTEAFTSLDPRQALTAAPLALALPGVRTRDAGSSFPNSWSVISGHPANDLQLGASGGTISGGGNENSPNRVVNHFGTVGGGSGNEAGSYSTVAGGAGNTASGQSATVPGGRQNQAGGFYSFAAGRSAVVRDSAASGDFDGDEGTFVWSDSRIPDFTSTGPNQFLIDAAGGVGINKNNPATALDVNGTVTASAFVGDGSGLTGFTGLWSQSGDDVFYDAGRIGIGTGAPDTALHVRGADNDGTVAGLKIANVSNDSVMLLDGNEIDCATGTLLLNNNSSGDVSLANGGGNVGIGTLTPDNDLTVVGDVAATSEYADRSGRFTTYGPNGNQNVRLTYLDGEPNFGWIGVKDDAGVTRASLLVDRDNDGNPRGKMITDVLIINGGSDIAEPYDIAPHPAAHLAPGMVVCIDPDTPGKLRLSSAAYDHTVAGIVSGAAGVKPGMLLSQEGTIADGEHPVALTGRVYCYVDADAGGSVQPGDLLTTSDVPGHAMKATDRGRAFGAILGKAMTPLTEGRGLVLVLVSLQ